MFHSTLQARDPRPSVGPFAWIPRELRYAIRSLRRRPGFSAIALLTLGLGIGGLTAIVSIVRGVLLAPLDFPDSDRLATYWLTAPQKGLGQVDLTEALFSYQRDRTQVLADVAAYTTDGFNLSGSGEPERLVGADITANFFHVLGVRPVLGREFLPREDTPGNNHVAILSQGFWRRHFGGDPSVIGRAIDLNGSPTTVVGVMPATADFPHQTDVWVPVGLDPTRYAFWYLRTVGRLRAGYTVEDLRREVGRLTDSFAVDRPESKLDPSGHAQVVAMSLTRSIVGDLRAPLFVLLASIFGVLLIVCANIATLSLARAIARAREMAVRVCLGASRRRLAAQLLTESALLALAGSAIGIGCAIWALAGLRHWSHGQIPRLDQVHIDPLTLGVVAVATVTCGALFGSAPAWFGSRVEPSSAINAGSRAGMTSGASRWNDALVVVQFAVSLALLIAAGLLLKSFSRLTSVDPGFRPDNVLVARMQAASRTYDAPRAKLSFYDAVLERIGALPGVHAAGLTSHVPFSQGNPQDEFEVQGREAESGQPIPVADERVVSPSYFAAIGTPILSGRDFRPTDDSGAPPVALVNEALARRYWPATDPLGKRVHFGTALRNNPWMTVVGVVADAKQTSLADAPSFQIYRPIAQSVDDQVVLVVRTAASPAAIGPDIRAVVRSADPTIPVYDVYTMDVAVAQSLSSRWLTNVTLAGFAGVALLLAAIGVYGVMSLAVAARVREFGVRLAVGARPTEVVRLVLRDGLRLAGLGMAIGLAAAMWLTRFLSSLLFATAPLDPETFGVVAGVLSVVALSACLAPAFRASRADPVSALKATE